MSTKPENTEVETALATARKVISAAAEKLRLDALALQDLEAKAAAVRAPGAPAPAEDYELQTPLRIGDNRKAPQELADRLAEILKVSPQDVASAIRSTNAPAARVKACMDLMRAGRKIHNIGSEVEPRWQHVIGDQGTPEELRACVQRLITLRPMTHRELVTFTGARENRISGALADLREAPGTRVCNLGDSVRARWLMLPLALQPAPLVKPKRR